MNMSRVEGLYPLCLLVCLTSTAVSSQESIGPNGIASDGLLDANGMELTGDGIGIGQVEFQRPGDADVGDSLPHRNTSIDPEAVYERTQPNPPPADPTADSNPINSEGNHAEWVAGVMISTDPVYAGVSPGAGLVAVGYQPSGPNFDAEAASMAQLIATLGSNIRATNFSFQNPLNGNTLNGNPLLTAFVDWSASNHDILYVVSGRNDSTAATASVPTDNFNGITVGSSGKVGGRYLQAVGNDYSEPLVGSRTAIGLLAPGENVQMTGLGNVEAPDADNDGTSFAAPHVTGTVALLQQYAAERIMNGGWSPLSSRHEVMKAVLLNSADKLEDSGDGSRLGMTRTVLDQNGNNWLTSEAYTGPTYKGLPLDDQMGAGHLNAKRALQQFSAGEHEANGGAVPMVGWDYGLTDGQDEFNKYVLDSPLPANQFVSVTLAWDRDVFFEIDDDLDNEYDIGDTFLEDAVPIDLNLYLMPAGATDIVNAVESSISPDMSVEHIFFQIDTPGMYEIWVGQDSGGFAQQTYALAWWMEAIANPAAGGDYSGNGTVGPEDYTIWKSNFGTSNAAADGNGNGTVDAADYTVWRDSLGAGAGGSLVSVPEPSAVWLMFVALVCIAGLRRDRK